MLIPKGMTTWFVVAIAVLGIVIVLVALRARAAGPQTVTEPAADAAMRGETENATRLIERVLASDGTNAEALFVRACIRLQAGNVEGVTKDTGRLESLRGPLPEVRILRELAIARGQMPSLGLVPAFFAALKKVGATDPHRNL